MSRSFLWGRFQNLRMTAAAAERLCREAQRRRERAASRHFWKTLSVLEKTGRLWADPASSFRRRAQKLMPGISGFSPAAVRETLEIIPKLLDRNALRRRLAAELSREDALDAWSLDPEGTRAVKAFPLGAVLHVAAGNIFLGCIDSVVMSLLTHNVTLLRASSADPEFPLLFAESLLRADEDQDLVSGLAVLSWEKGLADVEAAFKRRLQGIVVWGGESAVSAYRRELGVGCKLIAFGPKLSFAVVSRKGLRHYGIKETARRAARDVALWDQAACASPQALFIQEPRPDEFLEALGAELERRGRASPPGRLSPDEAAGLLEERQRALAAELLGEERLLASGGSGWTIDWRRRGELKPSPLHRFIRVRPYKDLRGLLGLAAPSAPYLQSAGILTAPDETAAYAEALAGIGLTRVPTLGHMLESETGEPHDGRYPLGELVRWVSGPAEAAGADAGKALASLLEQAARESPFYGKRLLPLTLPAPLTGRGRDVLRRVPLLDKDDLYKNAPPRSRALLTRAGEGQGTIVFASGGSTGKPKFCLYTQDEFERTCRWLAWGLRRSGLEPGDVVANLFVAGNLWSSFLAVSGAARALEVTHLPIAGTAEPALVADSLRRFKANALIGLPSTLLELARHAENSSAKRNGSAASRLRLEKIFYGGEHVSEEMVRLWKRVFGVRLVRSAGYASVDAGLIGFQCGRCDGTVHHAAEGLQRVEIVAPESDAGAAGKEYDLSRGARGRYAAGEIVVTNLVRRWMPVVRYRTGDLGRWIGRACPCGNPSPLFALLGRCDDRVNIGGAHLDVGDVGRAVAAVPGLSLFYQVVASADGGERLTVRAERASDRPSGPGVPGLLREALLKFSHELRDSIGRGWLQPPEVEILAPGALPRRPRTGKIRRVVDLRVR